MKEASIEKLREILEFRFGRHHEIQATISALVDAGFDQVEVVPRDRIKEVFWATTGENEGIRLGRAFDAIYGLQLKQSKDVVSVHLVLNEFAQKVRAAKDIDSVRDLIDSAEWVLTGKISK